MRTLINKLRRNHHLNQHQTVIYSGRVCEVSRVRTEQHTIWCDLSDAETGRTFHVPEHVLLRF